MCGVYGLCLHGYSTVGIQHFMYTSVCVLSYNASVHVNEEYVCAEKCKHVLRRIIIPSVFIIQSTFHHIVCE